LDDKWSIVWATWAAAFVVAEGIALASKEPTAPLSYHLRRTLGVHKRSVHHRVGQVAFTSGTLWLGWHLYRGVVNGLG
jgi:hypothetical protein